MSESPAFCPVLPAHAFWIPGIPSSSSWTPAFHPARPAHASFWFWWLPSIFHLWTLIQKMAFSLKENNNNNKNRIAHKNSVWWLTTNLTRFRMTQAHLWVCPSGHFWRGLFKGDDLSWMWASGRGQWRGWNKWGDWGRPTECEHPPSLCFLPSIIGAVLPQAKNILLLLSCFCLVLCDSHTKARTMDYF